MPEFCAWFRVNLPYAGLTPAQQEQVRHVNAVLEADPDSISSGWLLERLQQLSATLGGRKLVAACEEYDTVIYIEVQDGKSKTMQVGRDDRRLKAMEKAKDPGPPGATAADFAAAGVTKVLITLYWPDTMLAWLEREAERLDRSLSWLAQTCWNRSRERIIACKDLAAFTALGKPASGEKVMQSLYFPPPVKFELQELSNRLDSSQSRLMQVAVTLATAHVRELKPVGRE